MYRGIGFKAKCYWKKKKSTLHYWLDSRYFKTHKRMIVQQSAALL